MENFEIMQKPDKENKTLLSGILGLLLHHANRNFQTAEFYAIKSKIIEKHGTMIGIDIQFLEGVKCNSCGGTGIYWGWYNQPEVCWHCWNGWYKPKTWVILYSYKLGKYKFYQPIRKFYSYPTCQEFLNTVAGGLCLNRKDTNQIEGYIDHDRSKWGETAYMILGSLYDFKGYWTRWKQSIGIGWAGYWWKPRNWANNIAHLMKYRSKAIPFNK